MGRALMGTLVNRMLDPMANPMDLLASLKWHKALHKYIKYAGLGFKRWHVAPSLQHVAGELLQ